MTTDRSETLRIEVVFDEYRLESGFEIVEELLTLCLVSRYRYPFE
ncbi:hypothetical protein [Natronorubrum tibetense]|nr:hypothetical protein [Natronorubrum tibetense]